MNKRAVLPLVDGVRIVVPDSVDLLTPYVLREQGDWFEDEIRFVRQALEPGQQAIDIGANYGVYALSIGKAVGPNGKVWAFEPASTTAEFLAASIAENGFSQVVLERSALSSATGFASLSLNFNPELNALRPGAAAADASERVPLVTLDERAAAYDWRDIDFVKIDAEGEELNILQGGARFFADLSPLVQYEIRGGSASQDDLTAAFADRGYRSYRLVPGVGLLVPFDTRAPADGYVLNLFCCKPDRAARLAARGLLVEPVPAMGAPVAAGIGAYGWQKTLATLPYGQVLAGLWQQQAAAGVGAEVIAPLAEHALARDPARPAAERLSALESAYSRLRALCAADSSRLRLVSLARVARDFGARKIAVQSLVEILDRVDKTRGVDVGEPFLAPGPRFDSLAPGPHISNWVVAGVLEELERLGAHSSYFLGDGSYDRLTSISQLGFGSDEMRRRKELVERRFGRGTALPGA
jgi:protein O-GlcNAc transferase